MADESSFLKAILANPSDDLPRLVYADWLDEQGTEEASWKAEFLRLTAANRTETIHKRRVQTERRLAELARHITADWLPVVCHLPIENCATAENSIRQPLQTIEFEFTCPMKWEQLNATGDVSVRDCSQCHRSVFYCETIAVAVIHATRGRCVAVNVAVPRKPEDLRWRPRRLLLGVVRLANERSGTPRQRGQRHGDSEDQRKPRRPRRKNNWRDDEE